MLPLMLTCVSQVLAHSQLCELHSEVCSPSPGPQPTEPPIERTGSWTDVFKDSHEAQAPRNHAAARELIESTGALQLFARGCKFLSKESLTLLVEALRAGCTSSAYSEHGVLLCLHLLVEVRGVD